MEIVGLLLYIASGLLSTFSVNIAYKGSKNLFYIHALVFFAIAGLSIYFYNMDYLPEAMLSLVVFGLPISLGSNTVPKFIFRTPSILTFLALGLLIISIALRVFF